MQYPQWWERLVAGIIDGVIMAIVVIIISTILVAIGGSSLTAIRILGFIAALISTALVVGYKVFFESGTWQATPGKITLTAALTLTPSSPVANQTTTAEFTVQNTGGQPITAQYFSPP